VTLARRLAALGVIAIALGVGIEAATAAQPAPTIATIAGSGVLGSSGDGGPATAAEINHPRGIAIAPGGGFVFADAFAHVVRRVWPDGSITTVAGTGEPGFSGDGGPATQAQLDLPHGVAFFPDGTLLIADTLNNRIRAVAPDGTITTVAGTGQAGFAGDGGPATQAELDAPRGVTAAPDGGYLIPDTDNDRIRKVSTDGTITTLAGNGAHGFDGDGGPATAATLGFPFAVVPTADGGLLIADTANDRIRKVKADGTITTVAGDGVRGFGGDGGPATQAAIANPHNLAALPDGGFLIADEGNDRVRRVWPDGTITTAAGTGEPGFSGDGGPATHAQLDQPKAVAVLPDYLGFLLADAANSRVRLVSVDLRRTLVLKLSRRLRAKVKHDALLAFDVSDAVLVRLDVRRARRTVLTVWVSAGAGSNSTRVGRSLQPGIYTIWVHTSSPIDRPAAAITTLQITS
jgi:NHL repeat